MGRINTLDRQVRSILADDEKSRNSDIRLTQMLWWKFHRSQIAMIEGVPYVNMNKLFSLPSQDSIKRVRAKIQNVEKKFLPTDPAVAKKRGWEIEEWREYLGFERRVDHL